MFSLIRLIKKTYRMVEPEVSKTVMSNFASLSVLQSITYILPLIILPYIFRVIGAEKFGLIAFAQALAQYFMILTDYGFSISATKEISLCCDEHEKVCSVFSSVITVKVLLAFLSMFLMGIIVYFVPRFRADWLVYLFSFGTVVGSTLFPIWFFQGKEKMRHIATINIFGGVLLVVCIFLFVREKEDYLMVPLINSVVSIATGILGLRIVFRRFGVSFKFPGYSSIQKQLKSGWDIFISIVAINAYTTTRIFAVGLLTNNTITGYYSMAERVISAVQTFPLTSFSQAVFPRLSKIFHRSKLKALKIMQHIQQITINIYFIYLLVMFSIAHLIARLACGQDNYETVLSLRLLLISVLFIVSNAFRVQFLLVCGKTHIYSRIHVVMAILGLPLLFLLVYCFSYVGAAVATVIIEGGIFTITYITIKRLTSHYKR